MQVFIPVLISCVRRGHLCMSSWCCWEERVVCSQQAFYLHGVSRFPSMGWCGQFPACAYDAICFVCRHSGSCDAADLARFKLRNSLFVTASIVAFRFNFPVATAVPLQQPMRTPAQASINIIEKEDIAGTRMQAKYHAMENQASLGLRSFLKLFLHAVACNRLRRLRSALIESVWGIRP